jgi:multidrug transporter EmrE-like cation transporter
MPPGYLSLIVASVSLNALAQVLLRKATLALDINHAIHDENWAVLAWSVVNPFLLLAMLCYAASIIVWLLVLSKLEVSLAYPFLSIGYVITAVIGYFFLGEAVTLPRIAGIGLICLGLVVLSRSA